MLIEDLDANALTIENVLDLVGFYGPLIVILLMVGALHRHIKYMVLYVVFIFVNNSLNRVLKLWFQEARPVDPIPFSKYENYAGAEQYGMPSGHASAIGFSLMFLASVNTYSRWLLIIGFIGILTCIQRWKYRRHTIEQVCVGLVTGSIFARIVYVCATKYITSNIYVTR